ncbi:hypothetical protein KEG38_05170 [Polyangium jinanense]|uniref:hypothetical protein n=1 Tax=Polyangium jinanense TaxID=2829994 RepID=UPI002340DADB|nr:hypothetical protein [Polyangium jinanense]MDC3953221.1 hypothetical protein [Polyangium jinanense]
MLTTRSFSFSYARQPYPLARALARWSRATQQPEERLVSAAENDWAESRFLVELLVHAKPRRAWLGRERAREILKDAGSSVTLESLEEKFWVRFVVGQLEIPDAIRRELQTGRHRDALPDAERGALKQLVDARDDNTPLFWVERDDLERIHAVHKNAHPLTPTLCDLEKTHVIAPAAHQGREGYLLPWRNRGGEKGVTPWLCTRAVGLYWEALTRSTPRRADTNLDDSMFREWLVRAIEFPWWGSHTEHMTAPMRARLVKAATRFILAETDVSDPDKEVERFLWETVGFDRETTFRPPARPADDASLLEVYRWFDHAFLYDPSGLRRIRNWLDLLISLVVRHEEDVWRYGLVEVLQASRQKPYLIYRAMLSMAAGDSVIAGVVAHVETAPLGMLLLAEHSVRVEADFNWEEPSDRTRIQEAEKNRLWREAVGLLLGTVRDEMNERPDRLKECATALGETILLSVPTISRRAHLPEVDEVLRNGSEERLQILFRELSTTKHFVLFPLATELHRFLAARVANHPWARPSAEVRVLLWLLRTLMTDPEGATLDAATVAGTLLSAYESLFLRECVDDRGNLKIWYDDAPDMVAQPWTDLAIFLHREGRADELLAPRGVDLSNHLAGCYHADRYGGGDAHRSWLRKTRLHLRVLMAIHNALVKGDFDPVLGLSSKQAAELLAKVEERMSLLVCTSENSAHDGKHGSLFTPDKEAFAGGIAGPEGILEPIVRTFNRFTSVDRRDKAFADWIPVEDDPTVLLRVSIERFQRVRSGRSSTSSLLSTSSRLQGSYTRTSSSNLPWPRTWLARKTS